MSHLIDEQLTRSIIGAFFDVYNALGFGFLEHVYLNALRRELIARGHQVDCEVAVRIAYKGDYVASQRLDMVVDRKVVIEIKSTHVLHFSATRQLYNYLRASSLEVGLLLHFGPDPRFWRLVCSNTHV